MSAFIPAESTFSGSRSFRRRIAIRYQLNGIGAASAGHSGGGHSGGWPQIAPKSEFDMPSVSVALLYGRENFRWSRTSRVAHQLQLCPRLWESSKDLLSRSFCRRNSTTVAPISFSGRLRCPSISWHLALFPIGHAILCSFFAAILGRSYPRRHCQVRCPFVTDRLSDYQQRRMGSREGQ